MRMLEEISWESINPGLPSSDRRRNGNRDRAKFFRTLNNVCATANGPSSLRSVPAMRSQLQAEFVHNHYVNHGPDFAPSKLTLLETLETPGFSAATDALYLTQLGTSTGDQQLLRNGVRAYQRALQLLRVDLSIQKACHSDSVFATINTMSLCESFSSISLDDSGRKQHMTGAAALMKSRGPGSLKTEFLQIQLQQHQQQTLVEALMSRRRPVTGCADWLRVPKPCPIRLTELTTLSLRAVGVLEDVNAVLARGLELELDEILESLNDLQAMERDLQRWMNDWYSGFAVSPYWTISVDQLPWMQNISTSDDLLFDHSLQFPNIVFAKAHAAFWMPLLALRQTMKEVAELHPFPILAATAPSQRNMLIGGIQECADSLCMTTMFLCNPENGADGCILECGSMHLESDWYTKHGDATKLAWCRDMFLMISARGIRTPRIAESQGASRKSSTDPLSSDPGS